MPRPVRLVVIAVQHAPPTVGLELPRSSAKILCAGSPARGWVTLHLLSGLDSGHLCEFKANLILVCQGLVKWCGHSDADRYSNFEELCEEADRNWLSKENIRFLNRVSQVRILLGALSTSAR